MELSRITNSNERVQVSLEDAAKAGQAFKEHQSRALSSAALQPEACLAGIITVLPTSVQTLESWI